VAPKVASIYITELLPHIYYTSDFYHTWFYRRHVNVIRYLHCELEMWANAQRDGRPAELRWRPLFNAAKFG